MNLIRTLLAVVSFSVLLIACASPTGLAVGASDESTPTNTNSVSTQIIANEISEISSNALIMEQNQEVIVDSLTQIMNIQDARDKEMKAFIESVESTTKIGDPSNPSRDAGSLTFDSALPTKVEFLEELIVGQIADSALVTDDFLAEIGKVETDFSEVVTEMGALRAESEKAIRISEDSNKEIESINSRLTDLTNDTATSSSVKDLQASNADLVNQINKLNATNEKLDDQINELILENRNLSEKISDFIDHFNLRNKGNEFQN